MNRKGVQALMAFAIYLTFLLTAHCISTYLTVPTTGVMTDYRLRADPDTIKWGDVEPTVSVVRNITLTNVGTETINMSATVDNVVGLSNFTVTWNLEGSEIAAGQSLIASFMLTVYNYTEKSFSFDIVIQGEA